MMHVLLINSNRFTQPWPILPFGLCCVASAVECAGHEVRVLDLCFRPDPALDIRQAVMEWNPDVVGVGIRNIDNSAGYKTLFLLDAVRDEVIAPLKKTFGGPIVIGGTAAGINAAEILEYLDLDYAVRGDGEEAMVEFLRRIEYGISPSGMRGLTIRSRECFEDNGTAPVEDLDSLPGAKVYRHIDLDPYHSFNTRLPIQTKRGCAQQCSYCTYNHVEGRRWRLRSPERVADEIERYVRETGIRRFEFTDSTFNIPLDHAKAVLRAVSARGLDLDLRTMGLNPGAVDEELVMLMKEAGFADVDLGAESGCDATLRGLGKHFRKEDVLRTADLLHDHDIPVMWYLLVGGPGETEETLRETFDTINRAASRWDLVNVGIGLRVYKGAPIAKTLTKADPERAADGFLQPVSFRPEGIDMETLKALTKREALRHTNYFMYDEDETTPLAVQRMGAWFLRTFAPRQPVWRIFIIIRALQKYLGLDIANRLRLWWKSTSSTACGVSPPRVNCVAACMCPHTGTDVSMKAADDRPYRIDEQHTARMATSGDLRRKAWALLYAAYSREGYAQPDEQKLWYGIHDAQPQTGTIIIEREAAAVGTVSIYPQSPMGFPADTLYGAEIEAFCRSGRRPVEIGSLAVTRENDRRIVTALFDLLYLYSRCLLGATDLIITINPKHRRFYEWMLLFECISEEKDYSRVMGAPAVLMRLDLDLQKRVIRWEHGECPLPEGYDGHHTMYRNFPSVNEEAKRVAWLREVHRPLDDKSFQRYFIEERPFVTNAPAFIREYLGRFYLSAIMEQEAGFAELPLGTHQGEDTMEMEPETVSPGRQLTLTEDYRVSN